VNFLRETLKVSVPALIVFGAVVSLSGQGRTPSFSVDVNLVSLDVSVVDASGRPLTNLTQDDFQIFEDDQPREVKNFSSVETPYNVLALFDCTGSTHDAWPFLFKSVNAFLASLRPQDRVSVLAFGAGTTTLLDWTARTAEPLTFQLRAPTPLCDQTNFYWAMGETARKLRNIEGRKGVVVFTDGVHVPIPSKSVRVGDTTLTRVVDTWEDRDFLTTRKIVEESGAIFYFIAVNTDLAPGNVDANDLFPGTQYTPLALFNLQQIRSRMEQLAQASGGRVVFSQKNSDTGLLFEDIVRQLGMSYSLSFTPEAVPDGKYHRIAVQVHGAGIHARQSRDGYYARRLD
jgi:VWFA-related protein